MYAEQVTLALWLGILELGVVSDSPPYALPDHPDSDVLP